MVSTVSLVKTDEGVSGAYRHALELLGGIDDLNSDDRNVTIKLGIYDKRNQKYPSVEVVRAVVDSFTYPKRILLAESDTHQGKALDRLQVWEEIFSDRVIPFDLSHDPEVREVMVGREKVHFSHVLFKPTVLVSLNVLRKGEMGSIFKNLLGLIPDTRKERFHHKLGVALVDMAQAVGGIDLAVIGGSYIYDTRWMEGEAFARVRKDIFVVGRDPVAVETVGALLAGEEPLSIPQLAVAKKRNLGETDVGRIEVLGEPLDQYIAR